MRCTKAKYPLTGERKEAVNSHALIFIIVIHLILLSICNKAKLLIHQNHTVKDLYQTKALSLLKCTFLKDVKI